MAKRVFLLDKYAIHFDDKKIQYRTYEEDYCRGIVFTVGEWTYDIIHNFEMGTRLLMNSIKYEWRDIPFKETTFHLLPEGVRANINGER